MITGDNVERVLQVGLASHKWDGNYIMSDFIHKRDFIVYSSLVEPTPM